MVSKPTEQKFASTLSGVFRLAMLRVTSAWLIAVSLMMAVLLSLPMEHRDFSFMDAFMISAASGLVSIAALLPGGLTTTEPKTPAARTHVFIVGCVAAMAIRVIGTVALLVACRYQLGLPIETIAFLVCGWYSLLMVVEITTLARGLSATRATHTTLTTENNPATETALG